MLCFGLSAITRMGPAATAREHVLKACYGSQSAPGQPEAYPALYRFAKGQWSCTHVLHEGDRALVVLRFRWRPSPVLSNHDWNHPAARVVIVKRDARYIVGNYTVGTQGLLYVTPLRSTLLSNGFTRFSGEVEIPKDPQWLGQRRIMILVGKGSAPSHFRNSSALYGFAIDPIPSILPSTRLTVRETRRAETSNVATDSPVVASVTSSSSSQAFLLRQSLAAVRGSLRTVHGLQVTTVRNTSQHQTTTQRLEGDCALTPSSLAIHTVSATQFSNSRGFRVEYVTLATSNQSHTWVRSTQAQHRWVVADFAQIGAEILNVCPSMVLRQFLPLSLGSLVNRGAVVVGGHAAWHLQVRLPSNRQFNTADFWLDQASHYPLQIVTRGSQGPYRASVVTRFTEFNSAPTIRPPAPASPTPLQSPGGGVSVAVVPNPMPAHDRATITVTAQPGSSCTAHIISALPAQASTQTTSPPPGLLLGTKRVGKTHTVSWTWRVPEGVLGGSAMADCTIGRGSTNQVASFAVFS